MARRKAKTITETSPAAAAADSPAPSLPVSPAPDLPLRLEWRTPAELADNPANWRKHPEAQTAPLAQAIREVGWAGASLYNETTGRLIDGHARKNLPADTLVDGKLPVLVGRWTEEQERLILLTLDPLAAMAETNKQALGELLLRTPAEDPVVKAFLENLAAENDLDIFAAGGDEGAGTAKADQPPENRFGVYVECRNEQQQEELLLRLDAEGFRVHRQMPGKRLSFEGLALPGALDAVASAND